MRSDHSPPLPPLPPRRPSKLGWLKDPQLWVFFDTIFGPNLRWRDNLYQGLIVLLGGCAGALIGFYSNSNDPLFGAMIGVMLGIFAALVASGIVIMIYRALMHWRRWRE